MIAPGQCRRAQRGRMRRADHRDRADHPRVQHGGRPADQTTVGVTDQRRRRVAERADQARGVPGQCPAVVTTRRLVAAAVAAQVDRDDAGAGESAQLVSPRPPERAEPVQQDDKRPLGHRLTRFVGLRFGLHDVEPNAVGVHLQMAPRTADAYHRRIGRDHYQPDGSAVGLAAALPSEELSALALSCPGVSASGISLTVSMVSCGPRMRRTLR